MTGNLKALVAEAETLPEEDQHELVEYAREIRARRAGVYVMKALSRAAVESSFPTRKWTPSGSAAASYEGSIQPAGAGDIDRITHYLQ